MVKRELDMNRTHPSLGASQSRERPAFSAPAQMTSIRLADMRHARLRNATALHDGA